MSRFPIQSFLLPDLVSHCPYPLRSNPNCGEVARSSEKWLLDEANFSPMRQSTFLGLLAGELTAMCYPDTDATRLRVSTDFMNLLFTLDDWSDEFTADDTFGLAECVMSALRNPESFQTQKAAGRLAKSFSDRFRQTAGPGCTRRFIDTMDLFFQAIAQQAGYRSCGEVPSFEEYVALRWDTSGCKPCFALIEYAAGFDLPDEVVCHPVVRALEEAANACISWSNDLFSFNTEQARKDTHNMISVIMRSELIDLQEAVDYVGMLCKASVERFEHDRRRLPSWGPGIDDDVATYVRGLQNWMVGALHWSFDTTRYFGGHGAVVKKDRVVIMLPKQPES